MGKQKKGNSEEESIATKKMTPEDMIAQEVMLANLVNYFTNGNKSQFGRILGKTPQDINAWFHRGHIADIRLIYKKFPSINPAWLLSNGEGEMFLQGEQPQTVKATGTMSAASLMGPATVNVSSPDSEIAILKERIRGLEALIRSKDETIAVLKQQHKNCQDETRTENTSIQ